MRITEKRLRQIIREELGSPDRRDHRVGSASVSLDAAAIMAAEIFLKRIGLPSDRSTVLSVAERFKESTSDLRDLGEADPPDGHRPAAGGEQDPDDLLLGNPEGSRSIVRDDHPRS